MIFSRSAAKIAKQIQDGMLRYASHANDCVDRVPLDQSRNDLDPLVCAQAIHKVLFPTFRVSHGYQTAVKKITIASSIKIACGGSYIVIGSLVIGGSKWQNKLQWRQQPQRGRVAEARTEPELPRWAAVGGSGKLMPYTRRMDWPLRLNLRR